MSRATSVIQLNTNQKEFYAFLGLLSIKFAKMDYYLSLILGKLINNDENLITFTIIERNNITQNIELIKKINLIREFEPNSIKNLITKVNELKHDRNLFIHGVWSEPFMNENEVQILCSERKIKFEELKDASKTWEHDQNHTFRLSYIKKKIIQLDDLIYVQESLIKKLEDHSFN